MKFMLIFLNKIFTYYFIRNNKNPEWENIVKRLIQSSVKRRILWLHFDGFIGNSIVEIKVKNKEKKCIMILNVERNYARDRKLFLVLLLLL